MSKKVDSILGLAQKKLKNKKGSKKSKTMSVSELAKNSKLIDNKKFNSSDNDTLIYYTNNYIKKSQALINSLLNNIILENNTTIKRNIYIHYQILETLRHHSKAEKRLNQEINNYNSKFWLAKLLKEKTKIRSNKKTIIDTINSWGFETLLDKKYTFNREWSISRNIDSTYLGLIELYIKNKDTLVSQQIDYYEGVIDSTTSDFYKTELNKVNDTTYNGRITVFNNSIHSLGLKLDQRDLTLILLPEFKVIELKDSNKINFTIKNDTLSALLQDMCFFKTDSVNGKPMLRLITKERPVDNKYRTNNKLIEAFDVMKNER